jgi:hypothetical protein
MESGKGGIEMADVIKSYLISLSASTDKASFDKFTQAMTGAEKTVASSVGGILSKFLAFEVAGIAAFASVGFGIIGYLDKLAMLDRKQQILAMQNMMSVQQYRSLSMALDTMGVSIEDVIWGTNEMKEQFHGLIQDQKQLAAMVGPNYEDSMKQIRGVIYEFQRLELKAKWFGMKFAEDLLGKVGFGGGGIELQLERLNDFVMKNMPHWSDVLSTDVIPYFTDLWNLMKELKLVAGEFEVGFVHLMGAMSGDDALKNSKGSFEDLSKSIGMAAHEFGVILEILPKIATILIPLMEESVDALTGVSEFMSGHPFKAKEDFDRARSHGDEVTKQMVGLKDWFASNPFSYAPSANSDLLSQISGSSPDFIKLVHGVAMAESGDRQYDSSGKVILGPPIAGTTDRAIGRMQLMPSTAKMLGVDPYDTGQNIEGGEKYLLQLLQKHGGNVWDTLAEYGGFRTSSPSNYVHRVEQAGGLTIGSITINSAPNLTPEQHKQVIVSALDQHTLDFLRKEAILRERERQGLTIQLNGAHQ